MRHLPSLPLKSLLLALIYGVPAITGIGLISFGLAWKSYPALDQLQDVRGRGGFSGEATVTGLRSAGFGTNKDYFLRIDRFDREISIPSVILHPTLTNDGKYSVNLGKVLRVGDRVRLHTVGGSEPLRPVIISLAVLRNGVPEEILEHGTSSRRFEAMEATAGIVGQRYVSMGLMILPAGAILQFLWNYLRRRNSLRTRT